MTEHVASLRSVLSHSPTRVVFGPGKLAELGAIAKAEGAQHVLLLTDAGIIQAGHAARALDALESAGLLVTVFSEVEENPTTHHVEACLQLAREAKIDFFVGLGGGSTLDCTKGTNLLLTNGGKMADYWGIGKASKPMLPMIAVPTTSGTGSEAQSFALISDPDTHQKMACGDRRLPKDGGLRPIVAILDPELTLSQPRSVAAASGIDAIAHAIESAGSNARNDASRELSREAWSRLERAFGLAIARPEDEEARADMLLGAHIAGAAIERSMLGAAHACANPLTSTYGIAHGQAVGLMLPHVIRFNTAEGTNPYADLTNNGEPLAQRVEEMLDIAQLPNRLCDYHVDRDRIPELAHSAAQQWTASFNPRTVGKAEFESLYRAAFE